MIYVTPFRTIDKEPTGFSIDSGFKNIDDVINSVGDNHIFKSKCMVIYETGENRVIFSHARFNIEQ